MFSVGFDVPEVDLVAMLRPTMSTGKYIQQVGRGVRPAPGKTDCLILDFAGNVQRHGPIAGLAMHGVGLNNLPRAGSRQKLSKMPVNRTVSLVRMP